MTGRSKVDKMINGDSLLPPPDCRASRDQAETCVGTYVSEQSVIVITLIHTANHTRLRQSHFQKRTQDHTSRILEERYQMEESLTRRS
jgi:hypothetical protein